MASLDSGSYSPSEKKLGHCCCLCFLHCHLIHVHLYQASAPCLTVMRSFNDTSFWISLLSKNNWIYTFYSSFLPLSIFLFIWSSGKVWLEFLICWKLECLKKEGNCRIWYSGCTRTGSILAYHSLDSNPLWCLYDLIIQLSRWHDD